MDDQINIESEPGKQLWDNMVNDLHIIMGHTVVDPEREAWLDKRSKEWNVIDLSNMMFKEKKPIIIKKDWYLHLNLSSYLAPGLFTNQPLKRQLNLKIQIGDPHPRCTWTNTDNPFKTNFEIFVDRIDNPHAQEELLHAAQEALIQNHYDISYATFKTSEQLVHTSFLLDMAMSLAAVEEGTWEEWNQLANDHQQQERQLFLRTDKWDKTLLGKSLNRRFQFKDMSLTDIGLYWRNLGKYFDEMFDNIGEVTNHEMVEIFEFCCLAYGANHRDLSYSMIDLPIDADMSNEQIGRVVVDWAKRTMRYFTETEQAAELLGHHSNITCIPEYYFKYQLPKNIVDNLTEAIMDPLIPLPSLVNIKTLKTISFWNLNEKVSAIVTAWNNSLNGIDSEQLTRLLQKEGIPRELFDQLEAQAERSYRKQFDNPQGLKIPKLTKFERG